MKIKLKWNENSVVAETNATESDVYKFIGSVLPDMKIPNTLIVETDQGDAVFNWPSTDRKKSFICRLPSISRVVGLFWEYRLK